MKTENRSFDSPKRHVRFICQHWPCFCYARLFLSFIIHEGCKLLRWSNIADGSLLRKTLKMLALCKLTSFVCMASSPFCAGEYLKSGLPWNMIFFTASSLGAGGLTDKLLPEFFCMLVVQYICNQSQECPRSSWAVGQNSSTNPP